VETAATPNAISVASVYDELSLRDQVLAEFTLRGERLALRGVLANVGTDELWIGLPAPDPRIKDLDQTIAIRVSVPRLGAGAFILNTAFVRHIDRTHSRLFAVTRPAGKKMFQRRAFDRLDLVTPINVSARHEGRLLKETTTTADIGGGGVRFVCHLPLSRGDTVAIRLNLGLTEILASGVVERVEYPTGPMTKIEWLAAIRFISIAQGDQDRIIRHVFAATRHLAEAGPDI
jgi:uncharacterized C2H2 Zn-finger protein